MIDVDPAGDSTPFIDGPRPSDGDIVVREQRRGQLLVYLLRSQPGPDQIIVSSRDTALEQARWIATRVHVRAWLTIDGHGHLPIDHDFGVPIKRVTTSTR